MEINTASLAKDTTHLTVHPSTYEPQSRPAHPAPAPQQLIKPLATLNNSLR